MPIRKWTLTALLLGSCSTVAIGQQYEQPPRIRRAFSKSKLASVDEPDYHLTAADANGELFLAIINGVDVLGSYPLTPSPAPVTSAPTTGQPTSSSTASPTEGPVVSPSRQPVAETDSPSAIPMSEAPSTMMPETARPSTLMPVTSSPTGSLLEPTDAPVLPVSDSPSVQLTEQPIIGPTESPVTGTASPTQLSGEATPTPSAQPDMPTIMIFPTVVTPSIEPVSILPTETPVVATLAPSTVPINPTVSPSVSPVTSAPVVPTPTPTSAPTQRCNISAALRSLLIRVIVNSISDTAAVNTAGTPQNSAFNWITEQDPDYICPDDDARLIQRYVLAVFYYSARGDRWTDCSAPTDPTSEADVEAANEACTIEPLDGSGSNAWLTPGSECLWGGVVCSDNGIVERIDFGTLFEFKTVRFVAQNQRLTILSETNGLSGTIASEIRALSGLRFLLLEDGVMSGTIPGELGQITSLEILDLNFNLLGGSIPEEIYGLSNLRQLDLNDNLLEGTISANIGQMQALTFLQLQNNRITGTVPSTLGMISSLGKLYDRWRRMQNSILNLVSLLS